MTYRKLIVETEIVYDDLNGKMTPDKVKKNLEKGFCQYEFGIGTSVVKSNRKISKKKATYMVHIMTKEPYFDGILEYLKP